jgi:hypothetical protein
MIDANGFSTDLPEAFVDYNENGIRDVATEPYLDFDGNGSHRSVGDGKYNGILCASGAPICSDSKSLHVNRSIVIVLSDSVPVAADVFKEVATGSIDLEGCGKDSLGAVTGGNSGMLKSFNIILRDFNNNPLPAGTTVTVTTSNGKVDAGASAVVPNTNVSYLVVPSDPAFVYRVTIKNDAAPNDSTCKDPTPTGVLTVKIVPPVGPATEYSIVVNN